MAFRFPIKELQSRSCFPQCNLFRSTTRQRCEEETAKMFSGNGALLRNGARREGVIGSHLTAIFALPLDRRFRSASAWSQWAKARGRIRGATWRLRDSSVLPRRAGIRAERKWTHPWVTRTSGVFENSRGQDYLPARHRFRMVQAPSPRHPRQATTSEEGSGATQAA